MDFHKKKRKKLALFLSLLLLLQTMSLTVHAGRGIQASQPADSGEKSSADIHSASIVSSEKQEKEEDKESESSPEKSMPMEEKTTVKVNSSIRKAKNLPVLLESLGPSLFKEEEKTNLFLDLDSEAEASSYRLKRLADDGTALSAPLSAESRQGQAGFFDLLPGLYELSRADLPQEAAIKLRLDESGRTYRVKSIDRATLYAEDQPAHVRLKTSEGLLPLMSSRITEVNQSKGSYQLVAYLNNWHMFSHGVQNLGGQGSLTYVLESREPITKKELKASLRVFEAKPGDAEMPRNLEPRINSRADLRETGLTLLDPASYSLEEASSAGRNFLLLTLPSPGERGYILSLNLPLTQGEVASYLVVDGDSKHSSMLVNRLKKDLSYGEEALEGAIRLPLSYPGEDLQAPAGNRAMGRRADDSSENGSAGESSEVNEAEGTKLDPAAEKGPARIEIKKVDKDNPQITLAGAKFKLQQVRTGDAITGATPKYNAHIEEKSSDASGNLVFDGLPDGLFILEETEAPEGYTRTFVKKVYDVANGHVHRQNHYIKATETDPDGVEQEVQGPAPYRLKVTDIDMGSKTVTFLLLVEEEGKSSLEIRDQENTLSDFATAKAEVYEGSLDQVKAAYEDIVNIIQLTPLERVSRRTEENSLKVLDLTNSEGQGKVVKFTLGYDSLPVQIDSSRSLDSGETSSIRTQANLFVDLEEESLTSPEVIENKRTEELPGFTLKVSKTDEQGNPLAHAEFFLEGSLSGGSYKSLLTTDESGQVIFPNLSNGTYTLRENLAPAGYKRSEKEVTFNVENGIPFLTGLGTDDLENGVTFVNETIDLSQGAVLVVQLVDEKNPTKALPYIDFELQGIAGTPTAEFTQGAQTDSHGRLTFTGLKEGSYLLKQTKRASGYQYDQEGVEILVEKDDQGDFKVYQVHEEEKQEIQNALILTNSYHPNRLTFSKVSKEYDRSTIGSTEGEEVEGTPLQGVGFTLHRNIYNESGALLRQDKVDESISTREGKVLFPSYDSDYNPLDIPGEYEVWETNPVKGYPRPRYPMAKFKVNKEGEITDLKIADERYLSAEEWIAQEAVKYNDPDEDNTIVNIRGTASFSIQKLDGEGKPIQGAHFKLQDIPTAAGAIQDWETVTDENGVASWDILTIPQNYFLEEVSAPEGYAKPDNKWIVWVRHRDDMTYDILQKAHGTPYMEKTYPSSPALENTDLNGDGKVDQEDTALYEKTRGNEDLLKIQERGYGMELYRVPTRATVQTDSTGRYEVVKNPKTGNDNNNPELDAVSSASVIPAFLYQFFADSDELIIEENGVRRRLTMAELVSRTSTTGNHVLDRAVNALEKTNNGAPIPMTTLSNTRGAQVAFQTSCMEGEESTPLSGPIFEVCRVETREDGTVEEKLLTRGGSPWQVMADEKGQAIFDNLTPGRYSFKEIKVPRGYTRVYPDPAVLSTWAVYVNEDGTIDFQHSSVLDRVPDPSDASRILYPVKYKKNPSDIGNTWVPGRVEVDKVTLNEKGEEIPLKGATFALYYGEPGTVLNSDLPPIQTKTTDEKGSVVFEALMPGDPGVPRVYTLKEVAPPAGYTGGSHFWRVQVYGSGLTAVQSSDDLVPGNKSLDGDLTVRQFDLTALDKNLNPTADGVLWPNKTGALKANLKVGFKNPITGQLTKVKPGDYFTVKLDDRLHVGGLNFPGENISIKTGDDGKEVILANGIYDYDSKIIKFTFTDAIGMISGDLTASFHLYTDRRNLPSSGTYDFSNVVAGRRMNSKIDVAYGYTEKNEFWYFSNLQDYNITNFIWQINKDTGYVEYLTYYKPVKDNSLPKDGSMEFFIFNEGGFTEKQFEQAKIEVYEAKDSDFIESFGVDFTGKTPIADNEKGKDGGDVYYRQSIPAFPEYKNFWRYTLDDSNKKLIFRVRVPFDVQSQKTTNFALRTRAHRYNGNKSKDLEQGWVEGMQVNAFIRYTPSEMEVGQKPLAGYQKIYNTKAGNMEIRLGKLTTGEEDQGASYIPIEEGRLVMGLKKYDEKDESTRPVTTGAYDKSEFTLDLADQTRDNSYRNLSLNLGSQLNGKYVLYEKKAPKGYSKTGDQYVIQISQEKRSVVLLEVLDGYGNSRMNFHSDFDPAGGHIKDEAIRYGGVPLYIERGVYDKTERIPIYLVNPRRTTPHTGGSGILPFIAGGLGLMGLALGGMRREDRRKKSHKKTGR